MVHSCCHFWCIPNCHFWCIFNYRLQFNDTLKNNIEKGQVKAVNRASELQEFENPSSQLFVFINEIEKVKIQNNKR